MVEIKPKKEIPHRELDKVDSFGSARYIAVGFRKLIDKDYFILVDKVIYPINICPFCKSKATFHRRIQENGDIVGNVWNYREDKDSGGMIRAKFDFCLDCHREFLIELYIWKKE